MEPHQAPRTPPDARRSKIHTNIYSVPASGQGTRGQGPRGAAGLYRQPLGGRAGLQQEDRVQRLVGPGGVPKARPWGVAGGLASFPEVTESRWVWGGQFPPARPGPDWTLRPGGCQGAGFWPPDFSPPPRSPAPNGEGSTRVFLFRWGKTTVRIARFKLQIIKITIKNKKRQPLSQTHP